MGSFGKGVLGAFAVLFLVAAIFFTMTPFGRGVFNSYQFGLQKMDDRTQYDSLKKVEDEARMMMASYQADKIKYEQYKTSTDAEQINWGQQAKMRANQTAATYNNFMLKNSFLFKENLPYDLRYELPLLD